MAPSNAFGRFGVPELMGFMGLLGLSALATLAACQPSGSVSTPQSTAFQRADVTFRFSPAGDQLAAVVVGSPERIPPTPQDQNILGIYRINLDNGEITPLTVETVTANLSPPRFLSWSDNGESLAYDYTATSFEQQSTAEIRSVDLQSLTPTSTANPCESFTWQGPDTVSCVNLEEQSNDTHQLSTYQLNLSTGQSSPAQQGASFGPGTGIQQVLRLNAEDLLVKLTDAFAQQEIWVRLDESTGNSTTVFEQSTQEAMSSQLSLAPNGNDVFYENTPQRRSAPGPLNDRMTSQMNRLAVGRKQNRPLTQGFRPVPDPAGSRLAFLEGNALKIGDTDGKNAVTVLKKEQLNTGYSVQQYQWSEDGNALLVVTAPDQKQLFSNGPDPKVATFHTEYGNSTDLTPETLSGIQVLRVPASPSYTGNTQPRFLNVNWQPVLDALKN